MTYFLSAVGWTSGFVLLMVALVRLIDRLDRWGRKHDLLIVVPEYKVGNVIDLDARRAS